MSLFCHHDEEVTGKQLVNGFVLTPLLVASGLWIPLLLGLGLKKIGEHVVESTTASEKRARRDRESKQLEKEEEQEVIYQLDEAPEI
jgi:hypothetical protein